MPMTKAERAEFDAMREAIRVAEAQHRAAYEVVPIADEAGEGWHFNPHAHWVKHGTFDAHSHNPDSRYPEHRSRGRGGPWFQTEADALRALRNAIAAKCFVTLAGLDNVDIPKAESRDVVRGKWGKNAA